MHHPMSFKDARHDLKKHRLVGDQRKHTSKKSSLQQLRQCHVVEDELGGRMSPEQRSLMIAASAQSEPAIEVRISRSRRSCMLGDPPA